MPGTDLSLLVDAARRSGEIASGYWHGANEVWDKGSDDPVSEADLAVDTYLRETLLAARPGYGWLSEETEDDASRLTRDHVFIVDPIDGTRAFVAGHKTWAHSLAVARGGQITAAVVYLPLKDKLYSAALGRGAQLNGHAISPSTQQSIWGADVLAARPAMDPAHWTTVPNVKRSFRPSLAYRLALVAEGRFDAMFTLRDCWEWDIAAGALIATEAGADVRDRTGAALSFNSEAAKTSGVFVAPERLNAALQSKLRRTEGYRG